MKTTLLAKKKWISILRINYFLCLPLLCTASNIIRIFWKHHFFTFRSHVKINTLQLGRHSHSFLTQFCPVLPFLYFNPSVRKKSPFFVVICLLLVSETLTMLCFFLVYLLRNYSVSLSKHKDKIKIKKKIKIDKDKINTANILYSSVSSTIFIFSFKTRKQ